MKDVIGWASSLVLVLTIGKQVHKQWKAGTSEGVSKWLYVGQTAASTGFTVYSWMVHDWVFVVTNAVMLLSAIVGLVIFFHHRHRESGEKSQPGSQGRPSSEASNRASRSAGPS